MSRPLQETPEITFHREDESLTLSVTIQGWAIPLFKLKWGADGNVDIYSVSLGTDR